MYKGIMLAIVWLVIVNLLGLIGLNRLNLHPDTAYVWMLAHPYEQSQSWNMVGMHARWDSDWYQSIAREGYHQDPGNTLSNLVFFPLYPSLLRVGTFIMGGDDVLAGWLISSLFLVLACGVLVRLVEKFHPEANPLLVGFLLLLFPTAFFLNAVYTESLFLLLSLLTFYLTLEKKYFFAGLIGFLAALTRVTGVLLFFPLLLQILHTEGYRISSLKKAWPLALIPFGTALFFAYHWVAFGDPWLFFKIESAWGRSFTPNMEHFTFFSRAAIINFSLDSLFLIFGIVMIVVLMKRKWYPYAVYLASTLGVAVASGTLMSIGRYSLVLFPVYIVGASLKSEVARYTWIALSTMLFTLITILFVNGYWAG